MTIVEIYLIFVAVGIVIALPLMIYCEYNSFVEGHRNVSYWRGIQFLFLALIPIINVIAILFCLWAVFGDKTMRALSKPMIRETK